MIVQSAPDGEPRFVLRMAEHMALAGAFARAFGNHRFEAVEPLDEMLYVIDHHDAGWAELDGEGRLNPETGLPFNLVETPFDDIIPTSAASPAFNSRRHAYCGLLSSMHSWGLYNGRYGMSDRVLLDTIADAHRHTADEMLSGELARQQRLKAELSADPETAPWIEDGHLFQNYKQLQFFDTLALYFNCTHEGARERTEFEHVPLNAADDVTIAARPEGDGVYRLSPYPFTGDRNEFTFAGRYMTAARDADTVDLSAIPQGAQAVILVAG